VAIVHAGAFPFIVPGFAALVSGPERSSTLGKIFASVAALAVLAAVLTLGGGTARAATCSVPSGSYPTIQSAVSDPTCSIVNVAPGVYAENVVINNPVTLNGAQAGHPVAGRTFGSPTESTVKGANPVNGNAVFTINAANVTIDGFSLTNTLTTGAAYGIAVKGPGNNAVITNNVIDTITTSDPSGNGTAQAVYLTSGGPDGVQILGNAMRNIQSQRSAKGVLIGDNGGTNPSQNTVIEGNSITNVTSATRGAYGVSVANVVNVSGLQVRNNTINTLNGGGWVHAIGLEGDTPSVTVSDNTISNLTAPNTDIIGVWFESEDASFSTGQVHTNNFNLPATQLGIAVDPALHGTPVDGTCNWWNSPTGPTAASNPGGTGAQVSTNVTYKPWLIAQAPGGACLGGNVPTNTDQCKDGGFAKLVRSDGTTFKNQGDCIQYVNTGK
jgi:hypothetical protein